MAFDPDAYLAKKQGFDPDAYLAKKASIGVQGSQIVDPVVAVDSQSVQQPEPTFYDRLRSAGSNALDVAGEFAAGGNRMALGTADFFGPGAINAVSKVANYAGIGDGGQIPTFSQMGESLTMGPMAPGIGKGVVNALGGTSIAAAGMMPVARAAGTVGSTAADMLGFGSTQTAGMAARTAPTVMDTKLSLLRETGDASTAGKMLDAAGNVVNDPAQKAAQWQGFEPGFVAYVKSANPDSQRKMSAMLDIVDQTKKNWRSGLDNRPLNVIGDSVLNRIKVVREANRVSGVRLDDVANGLKGEAVDISPAVNSFLDTLSSMGMKYNPTTRVLELERGSATQSMPKVHKKAQAILDRLHITRDPSGKMDAYDVHVMKKWIDNFVDYGKSGKGDKGMIRDVTNSIKTLRHDLDATLDNQFDAYNKVNTQYFETKQSLDEVQDIAGKKFDPNDESAALTMGSLARRFLSNAQSNGYLRDSIANLDTVARKYITPGTDLVPYRPIQKRSGVTPAMLENDDLIGLAGYADELDKHFGAASKTSLFGDVDKAVQRGIDAGTGSLTLTGAAATGLKYGWQKTARINEQRAMKAMRELLQRGDK